MEKNEITIIIQDIPINKNLMRSLTHKGYFKQIQRLRNVFDKAVLVGKNQASFPLDFHNPPKKVGLSVTIYKKQRGGVLPDSVNFIDELFDSLQRMGVLYNDRDKWCKLESIDVQRGTENKTEVIINNAK